MGLLDEAGNLFSKGVASAQKGTRTISLKNQMNDLNKRRDSLTSELGSSLFEETRYDPKFREPRESLYASIESIDLQKVSILAELANIELQAQMAATNQQAPLDATQPTITCPTCSRPVLIDDTFCPGCGTNLTTVKADVGSDDTEDDSEESPAPPTKKKPGFCTNCGCENIAKTAFCRNCGEKL